MSENNNVNPEELVEEIEYTVDEAQMVVPPTDPSLSQAGMAADALATRLFIEGLINLLNVNGKAPDGTYKINLYAGNIKMTDEESAQTILEAFTSVTEKTAADIMYDAVNLVSVADAINSINADLETGIPEDEIDDIFNEVFDTEE